MCTFAAPLQKVAEKKPGFFNRINVKMNRRIYLLSVEVPDEKAICIPGKFFSNLKPLFRFHEIQLKSNP